MKQCIIRLWWHVECSIDYSIDVVPSQATHTVDVPSIGRRSHHASRMSMVSYFLYEVTNQIINLSVRTWVEWTRMTTVGDTVVYSSRHTEDRPLPFPPFDCREPVWYDEIKLPSVLTPFPSESAPNNGLEPQFDEQSARRRGRVHRWESAAHSLPSCIQDESGERFRWFFAWLFRHYLFFTCLHNSRFPGFQRSVRSEMAQDPMQTALSKMSIVCLFIYFIY